MPIRTLMVALFVACALVVPQTARAQAYLGPHVAWGDEMDFAIGLRAGVGLDRLLSPDPGQGALGRFEALVAFDWFLDCEGCNYFEVTPSVIAPLRLNQNFAAYLGAGLNIARYSLEFVNDEVGQSDTDLGLALLGGAEFPIAALTSFLEVRATLGGSRQAVVSFGLLFGPG